MTGSLAHAVVAGYGVLLLSVGSYFVRRSRSSEGFFLGGRTSSPFSDFGTTLSTFLGLFGLHVLAPVGGRRHESGAR